jgi:hypothetical protein
MQCLIAGGRGIVGRTGRLAIERFGIEPQRCCAVRIHPEQLKILQQLDALELQQRSFKIRPTTFGRLLDRRPPRGFERAYECPVRRGAAPSAQTPSAARAHDRIAFVRRRVEQRSRPGQLRLALRHPGHEKTLDDQQALGDRPPAIGLADQIGCRYRTSSKNIWTWKCEPLIYRIGRTVTPGCASPRAGSRCHPACAMRQDRCTSNSAQLAQWPRLCQILLPFTIQQSPSRRAVVRSAARSDPASGSE